MLILLLVLLQLQTPPVVMGRLVTIVADNVFEPPRGSDDALPSFQQLVVDQKSSSIYVGGQGALYRLWLYNINETASANLFASRELSVRSEDRDECLRTGSSPSECGAWVRSLFLKSNGQLILCSSEGMKPALSTLDGVTLEVVERARTVIGICSPHGGLNTTAVFAEFGNPDDLPAIYSGIRTGLALENQLIYRPPLEFNNKEVHPALRTVFTDSRWLNEPHFVGSFAIGPYVYFFFRELAAESEVAGGGKSVYSRVARVCKKDLGGGKSVLRQVWSSFVKARLNCSIPSSAPAQPPFHFDFIQSVVKVEPGERDAHFYATFTTAESHFFQASAVCAFSLGAINNHFDRGLYLEQASTLSLWTVTPPDRVPANRPGTCLSDSRAELSDEDLHFAKSHILMARSVEGEVVEAQRNVIWTKLVADTSSPGSSDRTVLFVLEPFANTLLKMLHLRSASGSASHRTSLLSRYHIASGEKVNKLALLPGEYLFVADEHRLSQYRVGQCSLYERCDLCAQDPVCSWNLARGMCFPREQAHASSVGWILDTEGNAKCGKYVRSISRTVYPGDGIHLACEGVTSAELMHARLEWLNDRSGPVDTLRRNDNNVLHIEGGGLVLLNVTQAHSGVYQCNVDGRIIVEHVVNVDAEGCARPKSVEQFRSAQRDWCKRLDTYTSNLSRWQALYEGKVVTHLPYVDYAGKTILRSLEPRLPQEDD